MNNNKIIYLGLMCTSALCALAMPTHAFAGPQGGVTTSGSATITSGANKTTINQSSNRAIIRWDSFDVGGAEEVRFNQPSSGSITVNRIRDHKPSQIDGKISANGKIILINPNGMVFGENSVVDVGGLVATTSDIGDDAGFMAGGAVKFTKPGKADAKIVNKGSISVKDAGLVGLVAPHVENHGMIRAKMGKVQLASGDIHTVDMAGDGLIKLEVSDAVIAQSVKNTGVIDAEGGEIILTAAQARAAVDALITNTGILRANTAGAKKGKITLSTGGIELAQGAGRGTIEQRGIIEAVGDALGESGGDIIIAGDRIAMLDQSVTDASGDINGGTIQVGGAYQGGPGLPTSDMVFAGPDAILNAESRRKGKGGSIILWSDDITRFHGYAVARGGAEGGDGGFIEISGKENLVFTGQADLRAANGKTGTLLLDPTNITISAGGDQNVSVTSPFAPNADDAVSVLNVTTLLNALASGNVVVQTRSTGAQSGNITVDAALSWASGNLLTLDAHGGIIVNQAINGGSLHMIAGADVALNANVAGTGTLTIEQRSDGISLGVGTTSTGVLKIDNNDFARIMDGWSNIVIGRQSATAAMDLRNMTWQDNVTLRSGTGTITFNAANSFGTNNLTIITDGDIAIPAGTNQITGTGTLTVQQASGNVAMNLGGGTGGVNLTATELGRITDGWSSLVFGRADASAAMTLGTITWRDALTVINGAGAINVTGKQTMNANALTVIGDGDLVLGVTSALSGTTSLTIMQASQNTGIGLGTGEAGALSLDATDLGRIANGWASVTIGREDGTGEINIGAATFSDFLTLRTGTGQIKVNGAMVMATNNHLTMITDGDIDITGTIAGSISSSNTAVFTIQQATTGVSMGIGDGQAGTVHLSNAELNKTGTGWTSRSFGRADSTAAMNIGEYTWDEHMTFQTGSGQMNVNGKTGLGAFNITLRTDSDVAINENITGTGSFTLTQASNNTSIGIGDGQAGQVHLSDIELAFLGNSFSGRAFGRTDSTADLNIAGGTWADPLSIRTGSGALNINGELTMGGNAITIQTDTDLAINYNITGTGAVTIAGSSNATSMGIGTGQAGTLVLDDTELARLGSTHSSITLGLLTATGDMNVGSRTWADPLTLRTGSGLMNINGNLAVGGNALAITTNAEVKITGSLSGSSTLVISPSAVGTVSGIGDGQTGGMVLSDVSLNNIQNGFSSITFGTTSTTGNINLGARTWQDHVVFRTGGVITVAGAQNSLTNNLSLFSTGNMAVNAALTGSGTLNIAPNSTAGTMGVGDGESGALSLDNAELARITDGWSSIIFGTTSMDGNLSVAGRTWTDSVEFRTESGFILMSGAQNVGANNLTLRSNRDIVINHILAGTGSLNILTTSTGSGQSMGIGDGQAGLISLSNAELGRLSDGWGSINFGNSGSAGATNVGAYTWNDSVSFRSGAGALNINGVQNMGGNNLTLMTNANVNIGFALNGTGTLTIQPSAATVGMGIGDGQTGVAATTVLLSNAELNNISDGWGNIVMGWNSATSGTNAAMYVGEYDWRDNLTLRSYTGIIYINGEQDVGANNLTIQTSANLAINDALTGTGTLTIQPFHTAGTMTIATSTTGVNLTAAELDRITDGWDEIIMGRADATGTISVGNYTWRDDLTLRSGSGVMTVSGAVMGANNLTLMTNSNLNIGGGDLSGTGTLTIRTASGSNQIGVGTGQSGALILESTDLVRIIDGWGQVQIGDTASFGHINIGTNTWLNPMSFITQGNVVLNGVQTSTEASGNSLVFVTTGGAFNNNAGAAAIDPGGGRYLVYSVASGNDDLDGIIPLTVISNTPYTSYLPHQVTELGNVFINSGVAAKILYLQIDDIDKIYGDNLPTFTYSYISGLQGADTLNDVILSYSINAIGATALDNAGTTSVLTGSFNTALGYSVNIIDGTMSVIKATLNVDADSDSRVYGDANPAFTATYSGFKNGDDETDIDTLASVTSGANALSDVGTYAISASGAVDNNYDFVYGDGVLTISKAVLTATVQASTREYGDANPAYTITYSGFKNGQNDSVIDTKATGTTAANALSNVGSYTVNGTGGVDNNYSFNYVSGTMNVTKATVTVTADSVSRDYGDANPVFTATYSGFKNGQDVSVIDTKAGVTSAAGVLSNVGTYAITASGAADNNYNFVYVDGTLTVDKATLTATANDATREYGDANPAFTVSYSGFKNGQDENVINTKASAGSTANAFTGAGSHAITVTGGLDDNYDFAYVDGELTITKAKVTVTADDDTRVYGDDNPTFGVSYSGFKNGEDESVLTTKANAASVGKAANVGDYAITASGAADDNYYFDYVDGTLTITKATLTVTANDEARDYGDANPVLSAAYSGFKNGQDVSVINTKASVTSAAGALSNVGTYAIEASGAADDNYDFAYVDGALTINKATITVTADDEAREYGDANPAFSVSYSGFKNGQDDTVINTKAAASSAADANSNVGTYAITASGAADDNYDFVYVDGDLAITKAKVTVTAGSGTRAYGDANPAFGVSYSGFKNGQNESVLTTQATATGPGALANVGVHAVSATGAAGSNYYFEYVDGVLTITKAMLIVTPNSAARVYGDANPAFNVSYSGFKNGQNASVLDTQATASSAADHLSNAGTYAITAAGAADDNYDFTYAPGTLTVSKATITAKADDKARLYGDINPPLTISYSGFKNGQNESVLTTLPGAMTLADAVSVAGAYAINVSGGLATNYDFAYQAGTLTITGGPTPPAPTKPSRPAPLPVTVEASLEKPEYFMTSDIPYLRRDAYQEMPGIVVIDESDIYRQIRGKRNFLIAISNLLDGYDLYEIAE